MKEAEIVGSGFVIVSVGDPSFERVVFERHAADNDLDSQFHCVRQIALDGFDFPQFAVYKVLYSPEITVGGVLDPAGIDPLSGEDGAAFGDPRYDHVLAVVVGSFQGKLCDD